MPATAISMEEYLATDSYEEFVDGERIEKPMGQWDHEQVIFALLLWFSQHEADWKVQAIQNIRTRLSGSIVRVPDVAVVPLEHTGGQIIEGAPILAIEVVSPGQQLRSYEPKVADYLELGVGAVWVIDPERRVGYQCRGKQVADWRLTPELSAGDRPIRLDLDAFFETVRQRKWTTKNVTSPGYEYPVFRCFFEKRRY